MAVGCSSRAAPDDGTSAQLADSATASSMSKNSSGTVNTQSRLICGDYYLIGHPQSGLALADAGAGAGAAAKQSEIDGTLSQLWQVKGDPVQGAQLVNLNSNLCLGFSSDPALGSQVVMLPCKADTQQTWRIQESNDVYEVILASANLAMANANANVAGAVADGLVAAQPDIQNAATTWSFQVSNTTPRPQWFYAGGCVGTVERAAAIPGRVFYGPDALTETDPFDVMQAAGLNAARVEAFPTSTLGPCPMLDENNALARELNFELDNNCLGVQVQTAEIAQEHEMAIVLTLNMGADIPVAWQDYNYTQMLGAIDAEVQRQLVPFLRAGVQPDIILLENEGTDGMLFNVTSSTGAVHARGVSGDANVPDAQLRSEMCAEIPTGNIASYPQLAGYYKQEILSARRTIQNWGFDNTITRFGLHSHGQYVDWKQSIVYSNDTHNESALSYAGVACDFSGVIPANILNRSAADMLDIMGFSSYAEPMTPVDPNSLASLQATFDRLNTTLGLMDSVANRYGIYAKGPFKGQFVKQGLGVEYASTFVHASQSGAQLAHTNIYMKTLQSYDWFLGALWWEPTYVYNNWEGGNASLYYRWQTTGETDAAPTDTLKVWGSFARSPQ